MGAVLTPRRYPDVPESRRLFYDNGTLKVAGTGTTDRTTDIVKAGETILTVGDWTMPRRFRQQGTNITEIATTFLDEAGRNIQPYGLWRCAATADLDHDGDLDFVLGNLGTNTRLHASPEEPAVLYTGDYDGNGSPDPLVGVYYADRSGARHRYPVHNRDDVVRQLPKIKNRFSTYRAFGEVTFEALLADAAPEDFVEANTLESVWLENIGESTFVMHVLPTAAQMSPINDILITDIDEDGFLDLLLSGNDYGTESNGGRSDASNGLLLRGNGAGDFTPVPTSESGFYLPGDGRDLVELTDRTGQRMMVAAQNGGTLQFYTITHRDLK